MATLKCEVPGTLIKGTNVAEVMDLLSAVFDPAHGRFSWKDHLPGPYDTVWSWSVNGRPVSGLLTRSYTTLGGQTGSAIGMVGTDPMHRGKGYSSALLRAVLTAARTARESFAVLWTRQHLLAFYETVGFTENYPEFDCKLSPGPNQGEAYHFLHFSPFDALSHRPLEALRNTFNASSAVSGDVDTVRRYFKDDRWVGVSGSRGARYGILYQGTFEKTPFYAIVLHGGPDPTIIEYAGAEAGFHQSVSWIQGNLKSVPVAYALTAPHLQSQLATVDILSQDINYYTMICRLDSEYLGHPITTWLDRV